MSAGMALEPNPALYTTVYYGPCPGAVKRNWSCLTPSGDATPFGSGTQVRDIEIPSLWRAATDVRVVSRGGAMRRHPFAWEEDP